MDVLEPNDEASGGTRKLLSFSGLIFLGVCLLGLIAALAWLAQSFPYERNPGRPITEMVYVAWAASAVSLLALGVGLTASRSQWMMLWATIFLVAIACRLTLVISSPILEVDFYRYLWDGIAANQGVSPYQISPDEVLTSKANDPNLKKLQDFIAEHPAAKTIVSRVHFEKYTTLYPPVSQFFFRLTTRLVPDDASVEIHIVAIKSMLVLFDVGVILCLTWLIAVLKKHPAWLIAYAWNPLVMKEIANGGHLDSIAIFFFTAGIAAFLWVAKRIELRNQSTGEAPSVASACGVVVSGTSLALGIGAKLFPIVVLPALCVFLLMRKQFLHFLVFVASCVLVSTLVLWPMFDHPESPAERAGVVDAPVGETTDGLAVFITNWRMNDAIFSFVYQNVEYDWGKKDTAWYVVVPNETRIKWYEELRPHKLANGNPAYLVARAVTMGLFALFYLGLIVRLWWVKSAEDLAGLLFLIMAVFFFLQPTQNPWYWLWAMPLVCFAKNRGWLIVSFVLFVYYLRFWFQEKNETFEFLGGQYVGADYFDHCIVWAEFLIVIALLVVVGAARLCWIKLRQVPRQVDGPHLEA